MSRRKHQNTLEAIFKSPTQATIRWADVEKMLLARGAQIEGRAGSRVLVRLNGYRAVFHRPHPKPETDKGAVVALRRFLTNAGVEP